MGKLKTASSKRDVPLNQAAVDAILDLRAERYLGEDSPLIPDERGNYTRPVNFRKRYYRILAAAKLERKGLHSLRHTFATMLVNGVKRRTAASKPSRLARWPIFWATPPPRSRSCTTSGRTPPDWRESQRDLNYGPTQKLLRIKQ